ncbi:hypothetical protein SAMN04488511_110211 [Pedobacter suwonensis]|uniref:Uncharacterized protein n=1 Tax=Pedobacter suwonensis TaxID=332999 RepID=A0A1I0TJW6_9SPHI|nr:hypothetical protein [Pedobacter suwonensis]SFA51987.1 hypothetical protein SAMN04488511_110211 [Pedobacter suwonensis]
MKNTGRFFALLDLISIFLLARQFWQILTHLNEIPDQILSQAKVILLLPLFVSLFISAIGLILFKKFGFIAYYIQFPFRLIVWVFSIGFITFLPEMLSLGERWFDILFRICFIAEFFRLYFTIKIHRSVF